MKRASRALFHLLYAVSGATALAYEVLWERQLRLLFGISTYSVAVVAAAFMGGLAAGYALGRSSRLRAFHPLAVYAAAEASIALYALLFPAWLHLVDAAYLAAGGSFAVRAVLALAVLLVPTTLMGVTFPVVCRWVAAGSTTGRAAASLLAANTAGGVVGTLATAWVFVRLYGAAATTALVTTSNFALAFAAAALAFAARDEPAVEAAAEPAAPSAPRSAVLAAAAFTAGFQTMALQVVWNRTLVCVVENNTTSFSLILASVLLSSAVGAALYAIAGRWRRLRPAGVGLLLATEAVLCFAVLGSIPVLNRLYGVEKWIAARWTIRSIADLCTVRWLVALAAVSPASAAAAFSLPLLSDLRRGRAETAVSRVFAADAAGSMVGALATGFVLIPALGLGATLGAIAFVALGTGIVAFLALAQSRRLVAVPLAAAAVGALFLAGPLELTRWYDGHGGVRGELLYYHEGVSGTISVFEVDQRKELLINCIEEVPNHRDALLLFKLLGHMPLLLHGSAHDVLVNALGGGITLGAVLQHHVDVEAVELVPEVRDAMRLFAEENESAADRTDWRLIHDDGRNYLRLTAKRYDVVTADATHPAAGESWPLYTAEYYAIVRAHLKPGGLFAQWLPLHNLAEADFLASMRTFRQAFPEMLVFFANRYCVLVGSLDPIRIEADRLTARIAAEPGVAADLKPYGIERGQDLLKYLVLDGDGVDRVAATAAVMTDDRAAVEFAELHRIGIPETFPLDLAVLLGGLDPAALARRTGVQIGVYWARQRLLEAQLSRRAPTLEATFAALTKLEQARAFEGHDQDVEIAIRTLQDALLRFLGREYREILARPDLERYLEILTYAEQLHADDPFLNQLLGAAYLRLERWTDALPYLEQAATSRPDDLTFQSNLAFAYEKSGRYRDALRTLERVADLDPGNRAIASVKDRIERELAEKGTR